MFREKHVYVHSRYGCTRSDGYPALAEAAAGARNQEEKGGGREGDQALV